MKILLLDILPDFTKIELYKNAYQYGTSGIFNEMLCHKHP